MTPSTQHEDMERRRGVALSIASVCIIITTIFFWGFMARWENDQVLIDHTYEVIAAASRVLVDTSQLQSAARGVIITNQQKARTSFQAVRSRIVTDSQRLRTLTADNPRQQHRLDDLDLLIGKKIEFYQREFDLLTAQGFEAVKAMVLSGEGEKHAQLIDANIESILGEEYGLLSVREAAFKRTSYLTAATATILSGIAIVFFLIAKKIIRKEESLLKQTRDEAVEVADQLKVSQNSLLKSHERLMNFIEYSPTPLAMFDNEMRYLRASRRWFSEFHLDGAEIYGRSHYEVFPEFGEKWKSVHRRALAGDDEEMVRELAAMALQRLGYTTVVASSGRVALDLFRENPKRFSLVLLDLTMPGLSGLEVLRELQLLLPDVKVVIMTGYSVENVNAEFTDARPAGFLPKPFQVEELAAILKQTLSVEPGYN